MAKGFFRDFYYLGALGGVARLRLYHDGTAGLVTAGVYAPKRGNYSSMEDARRALGLQIVRPELYAISSEAGELVKLGEGVSL